MLLPAALLTCLVAGCYALPSGYVLHEKASDQETKLFRRSRVHGEALVPIRVGLIQSNLEKGYDALLDISHPDSDNYGKHWTKEQVDAFFAPSHESIETVRNWLSSSGVPLDTITNVEKGWLAFSLPAKHAEALFQTEYYEHEMPSGDIRIGCDEYHLPEHVSAHVDYLKPGVALSPPVEKRAIGKRTAGSDFAEHFGPLSQPFQAPKPKSPVPFNVGQNASSSGSFQNAAASACSGGAVNPACIRALYNIPKASGSDDSNILGIWESEASYAQDDLNSYYSQYATNVPQGTGPEYLDNINGATSPSSQSDALFEADIDFEMAYSLIYPQQTLLYQDATPGINNDPNQTFLTGFLDYVDGSFCTSQEKSAGYQCGQYSVAPVVSISWTSTELSMPQSNQVRSCNEFMKLSMQGTTFVICTGDFGVASAPDASKNYNGCYDPSNPNGGTGKVFSPTFPSNCPYVLSVGGTMIPSGGSATTAEVAMFVNDSNSTPSQDIYFSSSGGFANYFPRPSYQNTSVSNYFSQHDPGYSYYTYNGKDLYTSGTNIGTNGGVYNRAGRGFPDVSANGVNFEAVWQGGNYFALGTSLSTPLWASLLTMINQNRTAQGKSTVGFVNPTLYANPSAFHDVTSGNNPGCESKGFSAVAGWDPVTGLGTPNYPALLNIFSKLK